MDTLPVIEAALGSYLVPGKRYPQELPVDLAPWYCYTADGGHSILCVLRIHYTAGGNLTDVLVPAPVRAVLRVGYEISPEGFVITDLPYDRSIGLVTQPGDDEY